MSLLALVGPASGSIEEFQQGLGSATPVAASISSSVHRINPYSLEINPSAATGYAQILLFNHGSISTLTTGPVYYRLYFQYHAGVNNVVFEDGDGSWTPSTTLKLNSSGILEVHDGTGTLLGTGTTVLAVDKWYRLDIARTIDPSTGTYTLKINGTTELNLSGLAIGKQVSAVSFGSFTVPGSFTFYYCDFAARDDAPPPDGSVYAYKATSNGTYTAWTANGAATIWQSVADLPNDGGTTYASSTTIIQNFSVQTNASVPTGSTVNGAKVSLFASGDNIGAAVETLVRSNTTDDTGPTNTCSSQYFQFDTCYLNDPATSSPWTVSNVNAVQVGAKQPNSSGPFTTYVTAVYWMVDYFASSSGDITCYVHGFDMSSLETTLFISGNTVANTMTLFEPVVGVDADDITLYIHGYDTMTQDCTLYVFGAGFSNTQMPLVLDASGSTLSDSLDLFVVGSTNPGLYDKVPLFIFSGADGNQVVAGMNLVMPGSTHEADSSNMNLWVGGVYHSTSNNASLFLCNTQQGTDGQLPLLISGLGNTPGALPFSEGMNLFVRRGLADMITLYLLAPGAPENNDISLVVVGSIPETSNIPLVLSSVVGGMPGQAKLFTAGF